MTTPDAITFIVCSVAVGMVLAILIFLSRSKQKP